MRTLILLICSVMVAACSPTTSESNEKINALMQRKSELNDFFHDCPRSIDAPYPSLLASAECFSFERLENPEDESSQRLSLKGMVLPSIRPRPQPDPMVILVGGPGQAATEAGLIPAQLLGKIRESRDIVLLDQRGTGENSPFQCEFEEEDLIEQLALFELIDLQTRQLDECLESLNDQNVHPEFYTTDIAVDDLEALRRHLGYTTFNLWGGSYGTRVALAYLQAYPEQTRTVVIDSVAPPSIKLPLYTARDASAALEKIFAQCEQDDDCNTAYPNLARTFGYLLQDYQRPQQISLRHARTYENDRGELSADTLKIIIRSLLYGRETDRLIPLLIKQISERDYQALATVSSAEADINQGMFLSVICSEDFSLISDREIEEALNSGTLLSSEYLIAPVLAACEQWPKRELPGDYFEPVMSDKPVLIFSGAQDPVTPPVWGDRVAETLSNSRHFITEGMAHISLPYGCTAALVSDFVESADVNNLDGSCLDNIKPRPFFLNVGGSAPEHD